ncbi:zinc finger protein 862-like [Ooceraea biroi]|uniref:zinc finger protein 862-like n=1 Tax=Ooceraea biroi TaxID=2015173 RepID=UPI000F07F823|nr:zinc finger protein 862-like [Ooceraea biroi]
MENRNVGKGAIKKCRSFQKSWLDNNNFKGWLAPHPVEDSAICIVCNKTMRCCKTDITRHSQTVRHIEEIASQNFDKNDNNNNDLTHRNKVKRAEIKLAAFFAEHNVAFLTADYLVPLLKNICIDSEIVQDIALSRNKCASIVKNVIAKRETEQLIEILKNRKFSILIDESTDITDNKFMCILVQYVCPSDKKVKTQLLDLLSLDSTDCSAIKIFNIFTNMLNNYNIPIQNIIGMASDNASVMIGCNNSFMSYLKQKVPELVVLNCVCHSSALIASKACTRLPSSCEQLIRAVATYISGSAKRCAILREFQNFFEVENHKI